MPSFSALAPTRFGKAPSTPPGPPPAEPQEITRYVSPVNPQLDIRLPAIIGLHPTRRTSRAVITSRLGSILENFRARLQLRRTSWLSVGYQIGHQPGFSRWGRFPPVTI